MIDRLRILFAGSGEFGLPSLAALRQAHHIAHVYTQPDRPAGRGRKLMPTAIARHAQQHELPLLNTADLNAETLPQADVLVVIAFGQKLSQSTAGHPRLGAINLHASLLPRYRGAAPIHHAVMNRERFTGNSVIRLAKRMDAGAILGQSRLEIGETETTGELHDRLAVDGAALVLRVLDELAAGTAVEHEQDDTQATYAPKLSRAEAALDFTRPAADIAARINGLSPWPGCHVRLMDGDREMDRLALLRARAGAVGEHPAVSTAGAGQGLDTISPGHLGFPSALPGAGDAPLVCARDGSEFVEVLEVLPQGRRAMSLAAYANGHPWRAGMHLRSA